jgi:hypothetical protein
MKLSYIYKQINNKFTSFPYTKAKRLGDVIWLIQYLAREKNTQRDPKTIHEAKVSESGKWLRIAEEHQEMFWISISKNEIDGKRRKEISLIARRLQKDKKTPPLNQEDTTKLIDIAIRLYESQLNHKRGWRYLIPVIASSISAFVGALVAIYITK